jgi:NNP family nitrate/nitrite transporter-like MFS transporter
MLALAEQRQQTRHDMRETSLERMPSGGHVTDAAGSQTRALVLATISFALSFAAWGLVGGLASVFTGLYRLTASETALLVAVPVLLGSLARLPMGMLTDRFGGRLVFAVLLAFSSLAAFIVPLTSSYGSLVGAAFLIGMAGSSFAVGAAFVSRWTPAARQGTALGVYGLGTMGQSLAVFVGPVVAARLGWEVVFQGTGAILLGWAAAYFLIARNPPQAGRPATVAAMMAILRGAPTAWLLGAFYFLTFGGFVAFSVYLPTLLRAQFGLAPADAGFRAAGFVVLATLMRPVGGWLADRIGGAQVLSWVFSGVALFSLLLTWPSMVPFTVGALGCAMLMGLGNGAVFKLVPEHFPKDTGTVTGLVGALGGLGGFFPPLLLGLFSDRLGVLWPGFLLLSATALALRAANQRVFHPGDVAWTQSLPVPARQALERVRAGAWAALVAAALAAAIVVGSRNLQHFDAALVGYTFATLFAAFGISYRYAMWLQRPPTRMYWRRGWQAFFSRRAFGGNTISLARRALLEFAANAYIFRRGRLRGLAHWLIMWGCLLAAAITFPLVWGWIHFETVPGNLHMYRTFVFGIPMQDFPVESARRVRHLPRARVVVVSRHSRRDARVPAPHDRSRRRRRAAVRSGHPAAAAAVRDQRHGTDADGELHVDARLRVRVPRDSPRRDSDRHVDLAAVRQTVSRVPTAGATRRRLLQGRGSARAAGGVPALRGTVRLAVDDSRSHRRRTGARLSLRPTRRRSLPARLPEVPPRAVRPGAGSLVAAIPEHRTRGG